MIRVTRGSVFRDLIRAYKIFINDVYCGDIMDDETKEFAVANGRHTVCAKIDWCRSNVLYVEVNNSIVELEVGNSMKGWRFLLMSFYMTIWKDKYLWLRVKGIEREVERKQRKTGESS